MSETYRWCVGCDDEQVFVAPPCDDGHGEECLDLACIDCGHAITVGVLVVAQVRHDQAVAA